MAEVHLDHPGEVEWFGGRGPAPVLGPCPHSTCPHDYVLDECSVPADQGGCDGMCRGWMAEWPPGEGPGGARWRPPKEFLRVDAPPRRIRDRP